MPAVGNLWTTAGNTDYTSLVQKQLSHSQIEEAVGVVAPGTCSKVAVEAESQMSTWVAQEVQSEAGGHPWLAPLLTSLIASAVVEDLVVDVETAVEFHHTYAGGSGVFVPFAAAAFDIAVPFHHEILFHLGQAQCPQGSDWCPE